MSSRRRVAPFDAAKRLVENYGFLNESGESRSTTKITKKTKRYKNAEAIGNAKVLLVNFNRRKENRAPLLRAVTMS